jgi:hypothetical protein
MAPFRRSASWSLLTRSRALGLLSALGAAGLAAATAYHVSDGVAFLGAAIAGAGAVTAIAGIMLGREDAVLWGSLPAAAGACLSGTGGLGLPDPLVLLGMTGASLASLATYEAGTTAALIASYLLAERPREKHDLSFVEEMFAEQTRRTYFLLGMAFMLTMAVFAAVFLFPGPVPASPASAGMFGALALTGAAAILVLRGGKFPSGAAGSTSARPPAGSLPAAPAPPPRSWGWGPGR